MASPTPDEEKFLAEAAGFLENPGILIRTVNALGKPLDFVEKKLPAKAQRVIQTATQRALDEALKVALRTVPKDKPAGGFWESDQAASLQGKLHTFGTALTGAVGGLFGWVSLPIELPVTTTLMLRSIAATARSFGMDLQSPTTQLECLYVFSLSSHAAPAMETSYYGARLGLANLMKQASHFMASKSAAEVLTAIEKGTAPALIKFIAAIAQRFQIAVSEKILAEAIPLLGAAGGALVNSTFTHYFNEAARYHFGIRKLEEKYGQGSVQRLYTQFKPKR